MYEYRKEILKLSSACGKIKGRAGLGESQLQDQQLEVLIHPFKPDVKMGHMTH